MKLGPGAGALARASALAAMFAGCAQEAPPPAAPAPPPPPAAVVTRDDRGVSASLRDDRGCEALLSHADADGRALRYRNECQPALSANLRTLASLLDALFGAGALSPEVSQLDAGRLVMTWPELGLRLALAARAVPDWDVARARRDHGFANGFVRELAERRRVFAELDELFGRRGRRVAVGSVEKVLIGTPAQTPFAQALRASGVGEAERLPFDAQLWLRLSPATPGAAG